MNEAALTVVPERTKSDGGRPVSGVIVTDNEGHRFRLLESAGKLALEQDTTPRDETSAWLRVESPQATVRSTLAAMLETMRSAV